MNWTIHVTGRQVAILAVLFVVSGFVTGVVKGHIVEARKCEPIEIVVLRDE